MGERVTPWYFMCSNLFCASNSVTRLRSIAISSVSFLACKLIASMVASACSDSSVAALRLDLASAVAVR